MSINTVKLFFRRLVHFVLLILLRICTLFYRRPLVHYTILPIETIIYNRNEPAKLQSAVTKFCAGKHYEQKLVGIAGTMSAGATIGVFSWPDIENTHYYAKALWYSSLLLAIFSLIGSSQQRLLETVKCLEYIDVEPEQRKEALRVFISPDDFDIDFNDESAMSWYTCNMVFVWQWTFMLMVWSWITFLAALMLHVIRPFLPKHDQQDADNFVAIWFLAVLLPVLVTYGWCAWWVGYVTKKLDAPMARNLSVWHMIGRICN